MRPWVHALWIIYGILAPIGAEGLTTAKGGPRDKAHYDEVAQTSKGAKDVVLGALQLKQAGSEKEAEVQYVASNVVDHAVGTGRSGSSSILGNSDGGRVATHVVSEGDLAIVHYVATATDPATVEIFRVQKGKIVEHWEVP